MSESTPRLSQRAQALLDLAQQIAARQGRSEVEPEHLLMAIASLNDGAAGEVLRAFGVDDARQIEAMLNTPDGAADMKRDMAKRMDTYIHDTAHDLKGKVASIKGYADLLSKVMEMLNKQAHSAEAISRNADIMLDMVNVEARGWLPLAEVAGGIKPRPCDLVKIAGAAVTALDRSTNTPDVGVTFDVPAGGWWVWGYESLLHTTTLSLAQEAVRRSEAGQVVAITLGSNEGDVWLRIHDQGPSLGEQPANQFTSIRLDAEGVVKGVPAAVMIMQAHGGKVEARNIAEGGVEIVVLFPKEIVVSAGVGG